MTPLMVLVLGPTASGKTSLGIALAQQLDCRVLSIDSRQLYAGMDIGTAKPTREEQQQAPHKLLNLSTPDRPINLQQFCAHAQPLIEQEQQRGRPAGPETWGAPFSLSASSSPRPAKGLSQLASTAALSVKPCSGNFTFRISRKPTTSPF